MPHLEAESALNEEFREIKHKGRLITGTPVDYIHTNDKDLANPIERAKEYLGSNYGLLAKPTLGMVVGTGGLLSICPELPIDIWLVFDNNQFVLDWVDRAKDAGRTAPTLDDYLRIMYSDNPQVIQCAADITKLGFENERKNLREYHLAADEQRFQRVKQSVKEVSIVRCEGDLSDQLFLKEAGDLLIRNGLSISFANLTNVYEHSPDIRNSLPLLPFREGAVFVWSHRALFGMNDCFDNYLKSQSSLGLSNYLRHAQGAYAQFMRETREENGMGNMRQSFTPCSPSYQINNF